MWDLDVLDSYTVTRSAKFPPLAESLLYRRQAPSPDAFFVGGPVADHAELELHKTTTWGAMALSLRGKPDLLRNHCSARERELYYLPPSLVVCHVFTKGFVP